MIRNRFTQLRQSFRRRVAQRIDFIRGFAQHMPPHGFREQSRIDLTSTNPRHARCEFISVDGLDGRVVGLEKSGTDIIRPIRRARQHQRPCVADDSRSTAPPPFDNTVVGQFCDRRDDGGPVHAKPFGERALRRQPGADRPIAARHLLAHIVDNLLGHRLAGCTIRLPINVQRHDTSHNIPYLIIKSIHPSNQNC